MYTIQVQNSIVVSKIKKNTMKLRNLLTDKIKILK